MSRHYIGSRRAWTPRFWPMACVVGIVVFLVLSLVHPGIVAAIAIGLVAGLGGGCVRWTVWRRRHPILSLDEYITDLLAERRKAAPWN